MKVHIETDNVTFILPDGAGTVPVDVARELVDLASHAVVEVEAGVRSMGLLELQHLNDELGREA